MKYIVIVIAFAFVVFGVTQLRPDTASLEVLNDTSPDELETYVVTAADFVDGQVVVANAAVEEISDMERDGLLWMREEEKLARDVYQELYDQWSVSVFENISSSEQTHMDAVRVLLDRYAIADPAKERGVFTDSRLQQLYDDLVREGRGSLLAAYTVGATIEDLDIKDLEDNLAQTDNEDIRLVYEELQRGSRNHLRAFNRQIERVSGTSYTPIYISEETFRDIVATNVEQGGGMEQRQSGKGNGSRQPN